MRQPELIYWIKPTIKLPDDGVTVLVNIPSNSEPVWLAYFEDGEWFNTDSMPLGHVVEHWAEMPFGPK